MGLGRRPAGGVTRSARTRRGPPGDRARGPRPRPVAGGRRSDSHRYGAGGQWPSSRAPAQHEHSEWQRGPHTRPRDGHAECARAGWVGDEALRTGTGREAQEQAQAPGSRGVKPETTFQTN
ncbi:hypothetical protein TYRP_023715 [Tyrophagus putrescentiae]|nr:hypothetical protein TYRP_023715 [Tyrophagus putrescentiae]